MKKVLIVVFALMLGTTGMVAAQRPDRNDGGWLGISISDTEDGVTIGDVLEDSPAAAAELQAGDIITAVDDEAIEDAAALVEAISSLDPETEVTLSVTRDGEEIDITATLGERPRDGFRGRGDRDGNRFGGDFPPMIMEFARPVIGVEFQPIDADFAANLGLDVESGLLILNVAPDSPADEAGLMAGDIITAVNDTELDGDNTVFDVLGEFEPGDDISVSYIRAGEADSVDVTLAEPDFFMLEGIPFGDGDGMPFFFDGDMMPFEFFFGEEGILGGDLLDELDLELPIDGEPFSVTCTDADGNVVISIESDGDGLSEFSLEGLPNMDGDGLEGLDCTIGDAEMDDAPEAEGDA